MIKIFRTIGLLEGTTSLALFLVAMPLKYLFGNPALVSAVGMIHGVAFIPYMLAKVICLPGRGLSAWGWIRTTLAAFVPFGTFINDGLLKRKQMVDATA